MQIWGSTNWDHDSVDSGPILCILFKHKRSHDCKAGNLNTKCLKSSVKILKEYYTWAILHILLR